MQGKSKGKARATTIDVNPPVAQSQTEHNNDKFSLPPFPSHTLPSNSEDISHQPNTASPPQNSPNPNASATNEFVPSLLPFTSLFSNGMDQLLTSVQQCHASSQQFMAQELGAVFFLSGDE
jgi:hypothetical protein